MASTTFRIKTENQWNSIYYRFKQGKQFEAELSIGIQVPKGRWSSSRQEILATPDIDYKTINLQLKEFDNFINREFQSSKLEGEILAPRTWLKEKIKIFFNQETANPDIDKTIFLTNFIEAFIIEAATKKSRKNRPIKKRTIQHYQSSLNKVREYESHSGKRIKLTDINLKFHDKFIEFLEVEQLLNPNTVGGYIDDIRLFCGNADKKDYKVSRDYKLSEFHAPSNETNDIYLNLEEIQKVYDVKLEQDYLDNARDWFVIGLWTGLRVSDLLKLNLTHIEDSEYIEQRNEKTEFPVIIPIHPCVKAILAKRSNKFPREISPQKFNKYIKEVCKKAGLTEKSEGAKSSKIEIENGSRKRTIHRKQSGSFPKYELVTSHTCRRSFATNLYNKLDTIIIMKITGHKTESQFLKYIKITPKEYAKQLKEHWSKTQFNF